MDTPGVSLFQGTGSLELNNKSIDRAHEEEALEDQRRRDEELGDLLQNAFDDLEDNENTMDSLQNSNANNSADNMNAYKAQVENEVQQLRMQSRGNEILYFKKLAEEKINISNDLLKRLTMTEAELERATTAKNNAHELLVECKEKCSNLENSLSKMLNEKKNLENENHSLLCKLETTQTLLSDVQRKYDIVERDLNKRNSRQDDLKRKQMEERHRAQIEMMQQQMDSLTDKLNKKNGDWESLHARYTALQASQEIMMVEKSTRIQELQTALSDAQSKCQELLLKGNYSEETARLSSFVTSLQQQISKMENTICMLNERLESAAAEVDVMESFLLQQTPNEITKHKQVLEDGRTLTLPERLGSLKHEVCGTLTRLKSAQTEIDKLNQILKEKTQENQLLREEENKTLVQVSTLKEQNIRYENKMKVLEEEILQIKKEKDKILNEFEKEKAKLQNELEPMKSQPQPKTNEEHIKSNWLKEAYKEAQVLKELFTAICRENVKMQFTLKTLKQNETQELKEQNKKLSTFKAQLELAEKQVEDLTTFIEDTKLNYEFRLNELKEIVEFSNEKPFSSCKSCIKYLKTITNLEIDKLRSENILAFYYQRYEDLCVELEQTKSQLSLSSKNDMLVEELKSKAEKFEEFIRTSSSQKSENNNKDEVKNKNDKENDHYIENQTNKSLVNEVKYLQECLLKSEQKLVMASQEYKEVKTELEQRQSEIELLKEAILAERAKMIEILKQKHMECSEICVKKDNLLKDCCADLKEKQRLIKDLAIEFEERQKQIEAERKSMKAVMNQWERQRQNYEVVEYEWKNSLTQLKEQHEQAIERWRKKYNSAKRTAANYKRYAEDKEMHFRKEFERLKNEYDNSVNKIEQHMRETIQKNLSLLKPL